LMAPPLGVAADFSTSLVVASDYVAHGLTRSLGQASLQVQSDWYTDTGFGLGATATSLNLNSGPGPAREFGLYARQSWRAGRDWRLGVAYSRYNFERERSRFFTYDYSEWKASASWRDLARLEAGFSSDYSLFSSRGVAHRRDTWSYIGSLRFPATRKITLVGGIGHYDLQDLFGAGYWFWSTGVEYATRRTALAVSYVGSDKTAWRLFGDQQAGDRIVAAIAWRVPAP
jgi:uncharacterized protein (TIGR02001 family)